MKYTIAFILVVLLLFSCKKENNEVVIVDVSTDYYPIKLGEVLVYSVTEINIDKQVGLNDTANYLLKEYFESSYIDDNRDELYRLERYIKQETDSVWRVLNIWYVTMSGNFLYKTEENYRYKRLIFPVENGNKWDGNIENTKDSEEYEITELDIAETIGDNEYSNVLTVLQNDNENLIEKHFAVEKYAKSKGLVYKEMISVSELEPQPGIPWQNRINIGFIYKQTLK